MLAGMEKELVARDVADPAPASGQRLVALAALLVAALPALVTASLVWAALGRPLLFRQERCGLGQRPIRLVKFRTMQDRRDEAGQLLPDVQRETAVTRWIRRVRLDEIPQLLSIAAGDMSFVGPRPLKPETIAAFGRLGELRCRVRPGLTGWAQVNGNTRLTNAEKLALDIWYVDHRSLRLDLRILVLTVVTILGGERVRPAPLAEAEAHLAIRAAGLDRPFSREPSA
ncbi:UDP-phosphate galactose phosphotransferase [Kaistia sp. 32K]|uniref:sugar transferase n=1 Tax=Kaistia sp. 32K TaxID=2795690 RepID=UPI001934C4BA|nr:sugar transferase [Kaistia sp. 32K]BCP53915.1 UDP-phosphate galactose phosphotransferase [Kaistia sp. 32K]